MRSAWLLTVGLLGCVLGHAQRTPCQRLLTAVFAEARTSGNALLEVRALDCVGDRANGTVALDYRRDSLIRALPRRDAGIRESEARTPHQIDSVDREVFAALTADIADHGFPRAGELSHEAHGGLLAIVWHNVRRDSASWYGFLPYLSRAVELGDIQPTEYAQLLDAYAARQPNTVQVYNTYAGAPHGADADGARLAIGLRPSSWTADDVLRHCGCY